MPLNCASLGVESPDFHVFVHDEPPAIALQEAGVVDLFIQGIVPEIFLRINLFATLFIQAHQKAKAWRTRFGRPYAYSAILNRYARTKGWLLIGKFPTPERLASFFNADFEHFGAPFSSF